jgi:CubicO group peptidase (beta-lactamase class C family)
VPASLSISVTISKVNSLTRASAAAWLVLCALSLQNASAGELSPPQTPGVAIPAGQIEKAVSQLDALAHALLKRSGIPGMAVAVVHDGNAIYAKGFGLRKSGETATIDADTVFQIASVSKSLSATVVAHQVGQGVIAWNTPIAKHLPWFALSDPYVTQHVTVGDMFAHRSGLPDHAGDHLEDLGYDRRQVLERLKLLPLASFRDTYAYTNFGLTAAAEAVAVASGKDWATLAQDTIYTPLGMSATSSRFADYMARPNRASPHVKIGDTYEARFQRNPDAQSPAGGVSSSVNDLAKWMAMVMQNGQFAGKQVVEAKALLPAITAQVISSPSFAADARPGLYGFGFNVNVTPSGRTELSHSGAFALGAGTAFRILPQANVGIIVLTNASPSGVPEALAAEFSDLVQFGAVTRDWFPPYAKAMDAMMAPTGELAAKSPPANPAPAQDAAVYTGTYANAYYGPLTISNSASGLVLRIGPKTIELPLRHWSGNEFTVAPASENETPGSISRVTFAMDGATAKSLTIEYLDADGLGTFTRN